MIPEDKEREGSRGRCVCWLALLLIMAGSWSACLESEDHADVLVSYEKINEAPISEKQIDALLDATPGLRDGVLQGLTGFDVDVYRVVYRTVHKGSEVRASGICVIPVTGMGLPMASYQHGTFFWDGYAPSEFDPSGELTEDMATVLVMGAAGYVCSVSDYIGYGESRDLFHPYHHAESSANACFDMLRASRQVADQLGVSPVDALYILGYSEGGYCSLALQRFIESEAEGEFNLIAVSAGAGAYNLPLTSDILLSRYNLRVAAYPCFLFAAYNDVHSWGRGMTEFFQNPFAERIRNGLLEGDYTHTQINNILTTRVLKLFNPAFLDQYLGSGETELKTALQENSLDSGWVPGAPLTLFHGLEDVTVPPQNSRSAYESFRASGGDVEYIDMKGLDHDTATIPWIKQTLQWFAELQ